MTALFELSIATEVLQSEELAAITGCIRKADQIEWLRANQWRHYKNRAGEPVVGRLYARMQLAGIKPSADVSSSESPSFDQVR